MSEKPVTHTNGSDDGSTPLARMLFGWTSAKWAPMAMFIVVGLIALGLLVADFMIDIGLDMYLFSSFIKTKRILTCETSIFMS